MGDPRENRHALSYGALGLLVGLLVGLSGGEVAKALLAGVFAFSGGSVIALSSKMDPQGRAWASSATLALSVLAIVGLVLGILAGQNRWLGGGAGSLDGLIAKVVSEELERRREDGATIEIGEVVELLRVRDALQGDPFYISEGAAPRQGALFRELGHVLQQVDGRFLDADAALEELRRVHAEYARSGEG